MCEINTLAIENLRRSETISLKCVILAFPSQIQDIPKKGCKENIVFDRLYRKGAKSKYPR